MIIGTTDQLGTIFLFTAIGCTLIFLFTVVLKTRKLQAIVGAILCFVVCIFLVYGGIKLSKDLFMYFSFNSLGLVLITWFFAFASGSGAWLLISELFKK